MSYTIDCLRYELNVMLSDHEYYVDEHINDIEKRIKSEADKQKQSSGSKSIIERTSEIYLERLKEFRHKWNLSWAKYQDEIEIIDRETLYCEDVEKLKHYVHLLKLYGTDFSVLNFNAIDMSDLGAKFSSTVSLIVSK